MGVTGGDRLLPGLGVKGVVGGVEGWLVWYRPSCPAAVLIPLRLTRSLEGVPGPWGVNPGPGPQ